MSPSRNVTTVFSIARGRRPVARDHERRAIAGVTSSLIESRTGSAATLARNSWIAALPRITTGARGGASGVYSIHSASSA